MKEHAIHRLDSSRKTARLWPQLLIGALGAGAVVAGLPAHAGASQTPWECSNYTGTAHTRCLEAFVETQRDQIATLQEKMQAQQETVNHLQDRIDRQPAQPPAVVQVIPPLYAYPPVGLSLYLGRPWIYGSPYFYRPYVYGPRYYGHRHRSHHW